MAEWTKEDIKTLRVNARLGESARWVGGLVGRNRGAVAYKAMMLGVRFKSVKQPKGVQKRLGRKRRKTGDMTVTLRG
jgi:hypothetical protein